MTKDFSRGWFNMPGRPGDRELADQMKGLGWLFANCKGKSILDAGCAEGLISIELAKAGALAVHGVELVPERVKLANKLRGDLPITVEVGDMNMWRPQRHYSIVIGLAILHKLRSPTTVAAALAAKALDAVVWRLPPDGAPVIKDRRSGYEEHDIGIVMETSGFRLHEAVSGHLGEWVGVYVRK